MLDERLEVAQPELSIEPAGPFDDGGFLYRIAFAVSTVVERTHDLRAEGRKALVHQLSHYAVPVVEQRDQRFQYFRIDRHVRRSWFRASARVTAQSAVYSRDCFP